MKKIPFLYELRCVLGPHSVLRAEILRSFLIRCGIKAEDIVLLERGGVFRVCVYFNDRDKAAAFQRKANQRLGSKARFKIKKIKNENWKTKFSKTFSVFALTRRFDVVPSWKLKKYKKTNRIPIILDSINAFGTGLHETTGFMAQFIESHKGRFKSFFDVGTGTGLLALIALKCGAKEICAIDFDQDAVAAAKQNFKINGYGPKGILSVDIEKYNAKKKFDFVAANLITRDLIKYKKKILILVARGGFLAISGIMEENYSEIRKAFNLKSLKCARIQKKGQWVGLLYKRSS